MIEYIDKFDEFTDFESIQKYIKNRFKNRPIPEFDAAAQKYQMDFLWTGCVSDSIQKNLWDNWFDNQKATIESSRILKKILDLLLCY